MAGERFVELAVAKLTAWLNSNFSTHLGQLETDQGLGTESIPRPKAVTAFRAPFDNRSPLMEVFDEGWEFIDYPNKLLAVDCTVAMTFFGDANLANGELFMRRYVTALIDTILYDSTLNNTVVMAIPTDGSSAVSRGDNAQTRHVYTQGVTVHVFHGGT